jgi:hypothetical protein
MSYVLRKIEGDENGNVKEITLQWKEVISLNAIKAFKVVNEKDVKIYRMNWWTHDNKIDNVIFVTGDGKFYYIDE